MDTVPAFVNSSFRPSHWLVAATSFVLAAGVLWVIVVGFDDTVTLPDGRKVTVIDVTYGTNHVHVEGPFYAKLAQRFVSRSRAFKLGLRVFEERSPWPSVMIWTRWQLPTTNAAPRFASVRDRHGIESEPAHASLDAPNREKHMAIMGWRFQNFPRLQSSFDLCFYQRDAAYRPSQVGEITVRNLARPADGLAPAPTPPVAGRRGGIEYSLVSLRSGEPPPAALSNRYQFIAPSTVAWFEVRNRGQADGDWMIRSVEVVGGTSNRFTLPQPVVVKTNGRLGIAFSEVLWPDEPVWMLAVEFARDRNFDPGSLVEFGPFPVVRLPKPFSTNLQAEAHGVSFQTVGVRPSAWSPPFFPSLPPAPSSDAVRPSTWIPPFRRTAYRRTTDVSVAYWSPEPTLRVDLARAVDDLGRELRFGNGVDQTRGRYLAGLEALTNTTTVQLTFAVQRSEIVEFAVRPVFAPGWRRVEAR
jgi:hypothetical protein